MIAYNRLSISSRLAFGLAIILALVTLASSIGSAVIGGSSASGGNSNSYGLYASFPSSPLTNDLYYPSDSPHVFRYTGSAWTPMANWGGLTLQTMNPSGWSVVNGTGFTMTTVDVDQVFTQTSPGTGVDNWRSVQKSGLTIPYTYTVHMNGPQSGLQNTIAFGFALKASSTGRLQTMASFNGGALIGSNFTTESSASANFFNGLYNAWGYDGLWLRVSNDGTTRTWSTSVNGIDYHTWYTETSSTSWLGTNEDTTSIGFYTVTSATVTGKFRVDHVQITNP